MCAPEPDRCERAAVDVWRCVVASRARRCAQVHRWGLANLYLFAPVFIESMIIVMGHDFCDYCVRSRA